MFRVALVLSLCGVAHGLPLGKFFCDCGIRAKAIMCRHHGHSELWETVRKETPEIILKNTTYSLTRGSGNVYFIEQEHALPTLDIGEAQQLRLFLTRPFLKNPVATQNLLFSEHEARTSGMVRRALRREPEAPLFAEVKNSLMYTFKALRKYAESASLQESVLTVQTLMKSLSNISMGANEKQACYDAILEHAFRHPNALGIWAMAVSENLRGQVTFKKEESFSHLDAIYDHLSPEERDAFERLLTCAVNENEST